MNPPSPASPARRAPFRVAFLGFSEFERTSLSSYLRLANERELRYELVYTLTDADFLVADADHAPSVQLVVVTERLAETVFIGSQAPPGAAGSMRRPIDALHVMRALDVLAHLEEEVPSVPTWPLPPAAAPKTLAPTTVPAPVLAPAPAPVPAARPPAAPVSDVIEESMLRMPAPWALPASPRAEDPVLPTHAPVPQAPSARRTTERSTLAHPPRPPRRSPTAAVAPPPVFVGPPPPPRALLVDDSAIALRFLASRLEPWCLRCDCVETSSAALEQLSEQAYDLIFIDVELGLGSELDGLALCRAIKRSEMAFNATVVMVSAHHSEIDRARGSLAGCDGYLGKPLKEAELATLLRRQGLVPPGGMPARKTASAGTAPA